MGGSLVVFAVVVATILWADWSNAFVWAALTITVSFAVIGFIVVFAALEEAACPLSQQDP